MITRRSVLAAAGMLVSAPIALAQHAQWSDWPGTYTGSARFYRSLPLEDIVPPPITPREDFDDGMPFPVEFSVRSADGNVVVWLRIDGGPMQTDERGETLVFGPVREGVALLRSAHTRVVPRSATLTVRPNQLATEALFAHADGSFWRRHFTANFTSTGADVVLWVFDATGTRARTWRGSTVRRA